MIWLDYKNEKEYILRSVDQLKEENIKNRILNIVLYDLKESYRNKVMFNFTSVLLIIIPASITLINSLDFDNMKILISVLSSISTILAGILALNQYQKKWFNYRSTIESMKKEISFCLVDARYSERSLLDNIEVLNNKEGEQYISLNDKK